MSDGCRQPSDRGDSHHPSQFRPGDLKSRLGALLLRDLVYKRLVRALEFRGSFFNSCFEFIAGALEGIFSLFPPCDQPVCDQRAPNKAEKKRDILWLDAKRPKWRDEIIQNCHGAESDRNPPWAFAAIPRAGNYGDREKQPERVSQPNLKDQRQVRRRQHEHYGKNVARQNLRCRRRGVGSLHREARTRTGPNFYTTSLNRFASPATDVHVGRARLRHAFAGMASI